MKYGIAVLISGRGSNLANLLEKCKQPEYPAKIECVISNNPQADGLSISKQYNIPTFTINSKTNFEFDLHNTLKQFNINVICLAGFMKVLSANFIKLWQNKIINIHPSLLPSFKGLGAQKQALEAGVQITGCTVHYVNDKVDDGNIIMQMAVPVLESDTVQSLSDRILIAEHKCYPIALKSILKKSL